MKVREPAVAGAFYPADADVLRATVDDLIAAAAAPPVGPRPHAIVVPHAGYIYSGPIAATAYATLTPSRSDVSRVVVLGPAHRLALHGMALPSVDAFRTPLGDVAVDVGACASLAGTADVVIDDRPHALEHSIEVQLPFLQRALDAFTLVPLVVGSIDASSVAEVIDSFWDDETLLVVSTDLSHYETYESAAAHDRRTVAAIVANDVDAVHPEDACGAHPLRGLLLLAQQHGTAPTLLDLRSSGDTAGSRDRVVGYGAFAVSGDAA